MSPARSHAPRRSRQCRRLPRQRLHRRKLPHPPLLLMARGYLRPQRRLRVGPGVAPAAARASSTACRLPPTSGCSPP